MTTNDNVDPEFSVLISGKPSGTTVRTDRAGKRVKATMANGLWTIIEKLDDGTVKVMAGGHNRATLTGPDGKSTVLNSSTLEFDSKTKILDFGTQSFIDKDQTN